jgi:hypothetical protein
MLKTIKDAVAAATVRFPDRGGQGVLVPGGLILTAAHVINWTHTGRMALGDEVEFVQQIEAGAQSLLVYPLAVEPLADLAVLGALDDQWHPDAADAFEQFCEATLAVPLAIAEFPVGARVPAHVFTHTGRWIAGCVKQWRPEAHSLMLEPDERIQSGTSGSPVVTDDGLLLGVVSWSGDSSESDEVWSRVGSLSRPHLRAPVWLARQMVTEPKRLRNFNAADLPSGGSGAVPS